MKQIVIAPNLQTGKQVARFTAIAGTGDFLLEAGFLPIVALFSTKHTDFICLRKLAKKYLEKASGLVLQGGADIKLPKNANIQEILNGHLSNTLNARDFFELQLLDIALAKKIPIFGICRGFQLINLYFGGTLYKNLQNTKYKNQHFEFIAQEGNKSSLDNYNLNPYFHEVRLVGPIIQKALAETKIAVNSIHTQGIETLGHALTIEAKTEEGLVEAISNTSNKILAVQWHPDLNPWEEKQSYILNTWLSWV